MPQSIVNLYLELRPSLVRFFAARTGGWSSAEDLVQELYLKALRQDENGPAIDDPKAWLFRVGLNLAIDMQRSSVRSAARDWASLGDADSSTTLVAQEPSAEAVVDGKLRVSRLLSIVEEMPPRMQEAFRLHKIDGLSQLQTADRMKVSLKAVEKHLAAALERLVAAMPEERR